MTEEPEMRFQNSRSDKSIATDRLHPIPKARYGFKGNCMRLVPVAQGNEEKIDLLDKRLANIESLLLKQQGTASPQCSCSTSTPETSLPKATTSAKAASHIATVFDEGEEVPPVEGPSSLKFQLAATRKLTEAAAIEIGTSCYVNALATARRVAGSQSPRGDAEQQKAQRPLTYRSMPLPPTSAVINILRQLKESPPNNFFVLRCFLTCSQFIDLCRNVYFSVDDYTSIDFIIVNSGLHYLFIEYFCPVGNSDLQKQHLAWGSMCRNALAAAVGSISAGLSAKVENVQALILGSIHAIEMAKPWLAWRLVCLAAQICMAAGFHDESLIAADDKDTRSVKALLFWHIYGLEKTLSLRVGRASMIGDCDILIPKGQESMSLPRLWASEKIVPFWVSNASIHGKLYDLLYSRSAQLVSQEALSDRADLLLADLRMTEPIDLINSIVASAYSATPMTRLEDVLAVSSKVMYYTTATLICRAKTSRASVPRFSPDCLEYARATIDAHLECIPLMGNNLHIVNLYLHWRLLQTPFIPLLVVFCHIVETEDRDDAQRLKSFADSLEQGANLSPSAKEFYHITRELNTIAEKHIETSSEQDWASVPSLSTFGLSQYFPANTLTENYPLTSEHVQSTQDMEMMFDEQDVMGFF
ncbi:hypothetical protein CORC01_00629 [Colletotrichum orchidophilum]|uniref:Xylanolytic transcriptional activator regulatory domain-containing protein n=1 Tax=Colletotrichum orchidophilum TaxID=1209926 RepID=A0A1G4BSC2_9PEZI|nr:uncharacterized protein CORC01_00629 [Colletotrichum orchidophilum]OHF04290.1 hypothetical protein CORC01_00629 [Colletotrichum orchidophilum]